MQQQQLQIVFSHRAGQYVWFDVVGPSNLIAAYQASQSKPLYHQDRPDAAAYCLPATGVNSLIKCVDLVSYRRSDGTGIGFAPDLDEHRSLMDMANTAGNPFVAEAFIKQAMATLDRPRRKVVEVTQTPGTQQPQTQGESAADALSQFTPPIDQQ